MKRYTLAAVAALLVLIPWHETVRADAPLYTIQDLGSFNGLVPTISGVNAAGQVAGHVNGNRAVRYTPGHGWEAVPGLGTSYSFATGINASGDVVGYYLNSAGQFRAFRYRDGIGVDDIAPVGDGTMTFGFGINDAGDVAGVSYGSTSVPFRAAIGLPTEGLPVLGGGAGSACGINAGGQVAGTSTIATGAQHGIRVDNGATVAIDIASPDGAPFNVNACAIDGAGRVGGEFDRASGQTHAFVFDGAVVDVDAFGSPMSNIEAINNGLAVGWYTTTASETRAFAHDTADGSFDLNTRIDAAGWILQTAKGVNGNGQIAGEGTFNGANAVFLLTPVAGDTTPPAIAPHDNVTAEATGANGASVTYDVPSTSDAVDGNGIATCAPASGSTFALGTTTVTCTASDAAGNAATPTSFSVVVQDTTPPAIDSLAVTPSFIWPANNKMIPVSVAVSASDSVDASPACSLTSISGGQASDVAITGPLSAKVRATKDNWGWSARTYVLQVSCSDAAGNTDDGAVTVTVGKDAPTQTYHYFRRLNQWFLWHYGGHR